MDLSYDKCSFEVVSGEVMISDPCYSVPTWCQGTVKARNGIWSPDAQIVSIDGWGTRVVELVACHEDYFEIDQAHFMDEGPAPVWKLLSINVGVDSGQCGIFDLSHYRDDAAAKDAYRLTKTSIGQGRDGKGEDWYGLCCDRTLSFYKWGTIPYGVVSSSGVGDGSYDAYAVMDGDEAIAIKIVYIPIEIKELD